MSDLGRKCDLSAFGSIHMENVAILLFGDASIEISKTYEDELHGKKYEGKLLSDTYENSRLLREFKRVMSSYGKDIRYYGYEKVYCYPISRKTYVDYFKYPGNVKDLPKGFVFQHNFDLYFENKNDPTVVNK